MGMIQRIKDSLERRRLRKSFRPYIDKNLVDHVVDQMVNGELPGIETKTRDVEFIFIRVREGSFDAMKATVAKVLEVANKHPAFLESLSLAFIKITFNILDRVPPCAESCKALLMAVHAEVGKEVAIVHGACVASIGDIGSADRSSYGAHLPHEQRVLRELMNVPIGELLEIHVENTQPKS